MLLRNHQERNVLRASGFYINCIIDGIIFRWIITLIYYEVPNEPYCFIFPVSVTRGEVFIDNFQTCTGPKLSSFWVSFKTGAKKEAKFNHTKNNVDI